MAVMLISEKDVESYAKICKEELDKEFKKSKATIKDLKIVIRCKLLQDYSDAKKTTLYIKNGVEYCRSLEILNKLIKNK